MMFGDEELRGIAIGGCEYDVWPSDIKDIATDLLDLRAKARTVVEAYDQYDESRGTSMALERAVEALRIHSGGQS